jgi:hypothetical protein
MSGRLKDAWQYAWLDIWIPFEQSEVWSQVSDELGYTSDELYMDLYVELVKALKKAPARNVYDATANDPRLARHFLENTSSNDLRNETAATRFFEDADEVIKEAGSEKLNVEFERLVRLFLKSRNLRYELLYPFELRSHLVGIFEALLADVVLAANQHPQLQQAFSDFLHSFRTLQRTHIETDMKTCIHKAAMLVEALASVRLDARGNNFGALCNSIQCWPDSLIREAVKKLYEFSSNYPGVRHNMVKKKEPRALEMKDSMIVPLLLLIAAGYFGSNNDLLDTLRSHAVDPPQEPAERADMLVSNQEVSAP